MDESVRDDVPDEPHTSVTGSFVSARLGAHDYSAIPRHWATHYGSTGPRAEKHFETARAKPPKFVNHHFHVAEKERGDLRDSVFLTQG
jgi:hypothetical protein